MAKQSRRIDTPAEIGGAKSARALSQLERTAGFARESNRIARATAGIATAANHRWQIPLHASFLKQDYRPGTGSLANRETHADGFESQAADNPGRNGRNGEKKTASAAQLIRTFAAGTRALEATARLSDGIGDNEAPASMARWKDSDRAIDGESQGRRGRHASAWHRTMPGVDAGGGVFRDMRALSVATDALSGLERSVESGSAALAISAVSRHATEIGLRRSSEFAERAHRAKEAAQAVVAANAESSPRSDTGRVSSRSRGSLEAQRVAFAGAGILASDRMTSSLRAVIPPANLSQREFAEPSGNARGLNSSSLRTGITINSSPTVVINAPAAGGNVERDAIGALRAHREELFNQLKRESARRERAQF